MIIDDYKVLINFICNLVLTGAFTVFLIFVFGRKNSKLYKLPFYKTIALKIGLAGCTTGALINCLSFSDLPWSQVLLNCGLAVLFCWAAYFHYSEFVSIKPKKRKKKTKYK